MNTYKMPLVFLNAVQVHKDTGITSGNLKYHRNKNHITGYKLEGIKSRSWLYRQDEIERLIKNHAVKATRQENSANV